MPAKPTGRRRRWLRVSLRGLMILILIVGVGLGWAIQRTRSQRAAIAAVQRAFGKISFDYEAQPLPTTPGGPLLFRTEPAAPRWLREVMGDELFQSVRSVTFPLLDSADVLAMVAHFDGLEELHIQQASARSGGWEQLQGLGRLRVLDVQGQGVNDAALRAVAQIQSLVQLRLEQTGATDAGFGQLAALPNLTELGLRRNSRITDKGITQAVAGLPSLQHFKLFGTMMRPSPSVHLTLIALANHHPHLQTLTLSETGVKDADLLRVGKLTELRHLDLYDTRITGQGLASLAALTSLADLDLTGTDVDDSGLRHLIPLTALQTLNLSITRVGDPGLSALAQVPHLQSLNLTATRVTDAGLPTLAGFASLQSLSLADNPRVTDASLPALSACPILRPIDLARSGVTPAGITALGIAQTQSPPVRQGRPRSLAPVGGPAVPNAARSPR